MMKSDFPRVSSRRMPGPIIPGFAVVHGIRHTAENEMTRRMGPGVRRDDSEALQSFNQSTLWKLPGSRCDHPPPPGEGNASNPNLIRKHRRWDEAAELAFDQFGESQRRAVFQPGADDLQA